jgi:putative membrane protein
MEEGRSMFVDYLTVMMVAVVAGAVLAIVYGLMFLEAPLADQRPWGWAFGVVGLLLGLTGLNLVLNWPLPGAYNIVMGEPALYFGLVLLGTALAIRAGESLMPLAVLAFFGGIANIFLSIAMLVHGLSRNPPLWAVAYAAIGLAAMLAPLVVHKVRALRWARLVAGVLLAIGVLIFALGGYGAYLEHTSAEEGFGKWVPPAMRQGP